jgi:DNA-binding NtrC family response regulator
MPRLCLHRTPDDPAILVARLGASRTRIGRTDDCDIVVPDESVSRLHCIVEACEGGWRVLDRSRNGVSLNGTRVKEAMLADGDRLGMGAWTLVLDLQDTVDDAPTERSQPERREEELLDASPSGIALREAWVLVTRGPARGKRLRLRSSRVGVGGTGSQLELADPSLVANHVRLRLAMGRAMVEPGEGAAFLGEHRVRDLVPLHPGEDLRLGATELRVEWIDRREELRAESFGELVGVSETMCTAFGLLRRMAAHHAPVLLIGESGTGKELAARAVHDASPRAGRPFVALNCGAITATLFESELFGHERGAFTGANERRDGAFHRADGGTLFLDEVGELPDEAQAKLLRVLESGEVRRVGGATPSFPDVRIVAATNRNLAEEARAGRFRADLYFRLAVLAVRIPPLRERAEDIGPIAAAIAKRLHPQLRVTPDALDALRRWPWPGNARELRNVLTRAWVLGAAPTEGGARPRAAEHLLDARHLVFNPLEPQGSPTPMPAPPGASPDPLVQPHPVPTGAGTLDAAEREVVLAALRRTRGNRTHAARELGIARSSLLCKLKRWGIGETGVVT